MSTGRLPLALAVVGLVVLALLPMVLGPFHLAVVTRALIFAGYALAFNVVFGMGGMPSLGHAAFFGAGGYVVGLGVTEAELGIAALTLGTLVVGALLGLLFGVATLRTRGIYLLLLTLALGQALWGLAFQQVGLTGGDNGIAGVGRAALPFGTGEIALYWTVVLVVGAVTVGLWIFARSPVGRIIVGIRESETRMAALGYSVPAYRITAFVVSGSLTALLGGLFVFSNRFVGPENLYWPTSAEVMVFAILGGAATFFGPALGAVLLVLAETWVSGLTDRWPTVLGLVYVLTILFLPQGLLGLRRRGSRTGESAGGVETVEETTAASRVEA